MKHIFIMLAALLLGIRFANGQTASPDSLITRPSAYTFEETLDRLRKALTGMGMSLMGEVDHAKAAAGKSLELRPTHLLLFGNPQVGTLLMQADQRAGLDLPLRLLVWQDEQNRVFLTYHRPQHLQRTFNLQEQQAVLEKMEQAYERLAQSVKQ